MTPCVRTTNTMWIFYVILLHLAGLLVAFDTTTENYTVPISSKCVLTCYVAEVRSFKVSFIFIYLLLISFSYGQTGRDDDCVSLEKSNMCMKI